MTTHALHIAMFRPVVLATDALIWLLLVSLVAAAAWAMRRPYWRNAYRQIARNRTAAVCFGVLMTFGFIGLTDSIHYRLSADEDVRSILDEICQPLVDHAEVSYSAPFAGCVPSGPVTVWLKSSFEAQIVWDEYNV